MFIFAKVFSIFVSIEMSRTSQSWVLKAPASFAPPLHGSWPEVDRNSFFRSSEFLHMPRVHISCTHDRIPGLGTFPL